MMFKMLLDKRSRVRRPYAGPARVWLAPLLRSSINVWWPHTGAAPRP